MKRIRLHPPGTSGIDLPTVRRAAVALANYAVDGKHGRHPPDPIHSWVTEGRREQYEQALAAGAPWAVNMSKLGGYSSCGDLAHWLLFCLGCRDERVVNRGDDGGAKPWFPGPNISRLKGSKWYVHASENGMPADGDVLHVAPPHHVCVLLQQVSPMQWVSADYGQPHGELEVCQLRDVSQGLHVRGRLLKGWVSLGLLVTSGALTESAIVPNSFDGGVPDDNPYSEDLPVDWAGL